MDQEAWNQIYADLERDVASVRARGGSIDDSDVAIAIDRARFAMERGNADEAIALIQDLRAKLAFAGNSAPTRGPAGPTPTSDRLDALEDNLHATTRLGSARLEIVGEAEEPLTRASSQNTKVNRSIKYEDIKDEYTRIWGSAKLRPENASAVKREADRVIANRSVYQEISDETDVPWWFIGLIHGMECSFSLQKHLHNGDSLKARTWQVPAGRPKDGSPPFTFVGSATDALNYDGFAGKEDWPLPMVLYRLERYNGFGYRKKFGFASPYLWSYTNHFTSGKYVKDGVFDPNAVSKQCGAAAMLRDLIDRGVVSFDGKPADVTVAAGPKPTPPTQPEQPIPAPTPIAAPIPGSIPGSTAQPSATTQPSAPADKPETVSSAPTTVPAATPAPASPPAPAPEMTPASAPAATPAPLPAAAIPPIAKPIETAAVTPPPPPSQQPAGQPAPVPAPPAVTSPAPASPATPSPAPTSQAATPSPTPSAGAPPAATSGVSSAVAAALAELAKRSK